MNFHRGMAAAAALALAVMTAACSSDDEPDPAPTTSPPSASPTPGPASEDPGSSSVPLSGNDDVAIDWVLDDVNGSDPVVDVARRTISLTLLVSWSPDWSDEKKIAQAADALAVDDSVLLEPLRGQSVTAAPTEVRRVRILVRQPVGEGDHATAWMCIDHDATTFKSKSGVLASVTLTVTDGLWKATEYNLDPEVTDEQEPYFLRCRKPF